MQPKAMANRLRKVVRALEGRYEWEARGGDLPQIEELILTLLAYDTSWKLGERAVEAFKREFVDWNEVRVASPDELTALPEMERIPRARQKAEILTKAIDRIFLDNNRIVLAFGPDQVEEARKYLGGVRDLPSIVRNLFIYRLFRYPKAVADVGVTRVLRRLGILPPNAGEETAQRLLDKMFTGPLAASAYYALARHAEATCVEEDYDCLHCPLLADCQTGQERKATKKVVKE